MRRLGLALAAIVPLAACAADPNYLTGTGGTGGAPVLKLSHPNPIVSRAAQGSGAAMMFGTSLA